MSFNLHIIIFACILSGAIGTEVKQCSGNKPFPLEVRVLNCTIPPCDVIKGTVMEFEIDFVVFKETTAISTQVRATALGVTVPYELPSEVEDVCANLMHGAYCPMDPTEDATYLFVLPIGSYPEIGVRVQVSLVDQDGDVVSCFMCDIKVRKGNTETNIFIDKNSTP